MSTDPHQTGDDRVGLGYLGRLFLLEPGWRIGRKAGSEREFCYAMAPGQDYYHRLFDGEIVLTRAEERLCLACAERRGLLSHAPRSLGEPAILIDLHGRPTASEYELGPSAVPESVD